MYDSQTSLALEFDKVMERALLGVVNPEAATLYRQIPPHSALAPAQTALQVVSDLAASDREGVMSFAPCLLAPVRPVVAACRRGGSVITLPGLVGLSDYFCYLKSVLAFFGRLEKNSYPYLALERRKFTAQAVLHAALLRILDKDGQIRDDASPELFRARADIAAAREQIKSALVGIIGCPHRSKHLMERVISQRDGRYLLLIRSDGRGAFSGIVHDRSASGKALFLEPTEVIALNNRLKERLVESKWQEQKVLKDYTALLRPELGLVSENLSALLLLEARWALAAYANRIGGAVPELCLGNQVVIKAGRHPLLIEHLGREVAVAFDLELGRACKTLIVSGANTGGKTVFLKAVGLLGMMVAHGILPPVDPDSSIPLYQHVVAAIDDNQDISQGMSTFSSQLGRIVQILGECDQPGTLVLCDELCVGTDPHEGAALAAAIIEHIHLHTAAQLIVTSHYGALKRLAGRYEGIDNACLPFDEQSLRPTYRPLIGHAGRSYGLRIARMCGIPGKVVRRGRHFLRERALAGDRLFEQLEEARSELARLADEKEQVLRELATARAAAVKVTTDAKAQAKIRVAAAATEATELVAKLRCELREQRRQAAKAEKQAAASSRPQLDRIDATLVSVEKELQLRPQPKPLAARKPVGAVLWQVGQEAFCPRLRMQGQILDINSAKQQARVQLGSMKMVLAFSELSPPKKVSGQRDVPRYSVQAEVTRSAFSDTLDLHGVRYQAASERLQKFLDDLLLVDVGRAKIIHGLGSGVLRRLTHQVLSERAEVRSFAAGDECEGGGGVTIVTFR